MPVDRQIPAALARSGENVTGDTLARFYALHVVILPLVTFAVLGLHLFLVQKHGISVPEGAARRLGGAEKVPTMPFVPHFLLRDMVGWYVALGLLAALAALFPWELGQKADPFGSAPEGIKPEWYFLFMFQALEEAAASPLWTSTGWRERSGGAVFRCLRADGAAGSVSGLRRRSRPAAPRVELSWPRWRLYSSSS